MNIANRVHPFLWISKMNIQGLFDMSHAVTKSVMKILVFPVCFSVSCVTLVMGLVLQVLKHSYGTVRRSPGCSWLQPFVGN